MRKHRLVTLSIDLDSRELVVETGASQIEIARDRPHGETVIDHEEAAHRLVRHAFLALEAEGFPRGGPL